MNASLALGLALLETCWLTPWSALLAAWLGADAAVLPAPAIAALLLFARGAARRASGVQTYPKAARLGLVSLGLVAALAATALAHGPADTASLAPHLVDGRLAPPRLTPAAAAAFLGLIVWWRGTLHGRGSLTFDAIADAFKLGVGGLVGFLVVAATTEPTSYSALQAGAAPWALGFFFTGLITLALARLAAVRAESQARHGHAPALNRQWLGVLLGAVAATLALALLSAQLLSFDLIRAVWSPIGTAISTVLLILIMIIALPVAFLLEPLIQLLRRFIPPNLLQRQSGGDLSRSPFEELMRSRTPVEVSPEAVALGQWIVVAVLLVVAAVVLWRAAMWWRETTRDPDVAEERDSVWNWAIARAELARWLRALVNRLLRRRALAPAGAPGVAMAATAAPTPEAASMRELYRRLLTLGAAAGRPRLPPTTPHEHLDALDDALEPRDDLAVLTDAYVEARYGANAPDAAALARARDALARVRTTPPQPPMR
jgi:hypothetical protein